MQAGAALLDLTPFTKIDIVGPDALASMQRLCTADIAAFGRAIYTPRAAPFTVQRPAPIAWGHCLAGSEATPCVQTPSTGCEVRAW